MLTRIEGVYRDGKIDLEALPENMPNDTRVIVTFLSPDLQARGIDEVHAAELRARLHTFALDWDSPEMAIYDDYDAAKAEL
jgi:hypothetical protein